MPDVVKVFALIPRRPDVATAVPEMYADNSAPLYDAVVEVWCDDAQSAAATGDAVAGALDGVADPERSAGFLARELRVLWP